MSKGISDIMPFFDRSGARTEYDPKKAWIPIDDIESGFIGMQEVTEGGYERWWEGKTGVLLNSTCKRGNGKGLIIVASTMEPDNYLKNIWNESAGKDISRGFFTPAWDQDKPH